MLLHLLASEFLWTALQGLKCSDVGIGAAAERDAIEVERQPSNRRTCFNARRAGLEVEIGTSWSQHIWIRRQPARIETQTLPTRERVRCSTVVKEFLTSGPIAVENVVVARRDEIAGLVGHVDLAIVAPGFGSQDVAHENVVLQVGDDCSVALHVDPASRRPTSPAYIGLTVNDVVIDQSTSRSILYDNANPVFV